MRTLAALACVAVLFLSHHMGKPQVRESRKSADFAQRVLAPDTGHSAFDGVRPTQQHLC